MEQKLKEYGAELVRSFEFAVETAKMEKKSNRTSKYNMTVDIKDNLHDPLKEFAQEKGIEYHRSNLSQFFIIDNQKVKIKFHNSLSRKKRKIIQQAENPQIKLPLECFKQTHAEVEAEWEIGIETSAERTALKVLRIVDFPNRIVKTVFDSKTSNLVELKQRIKSNQKEEHGNNLIKNKITTKEIYKSQENKESKIENDI